MVMLLVLSDWFSTRDNLIQARTIEVKSNKQAKAKKMPGRKRGPPKGALKRGKPVKILSAPTCKGEANDGVFKKGAEEGDADMSETEEDEAHREVQKLKDTPFSLAVM